MVVETGSYQGSGWSSTLMSIFFDVAGVHPGDSNVHAVGLTGIRQFVLKPNAQEEPLRSRTQGARRGVHPAPLAQDHSGGLVWRQLSKWAMTSMADLEPLHRRTPESSADTRFQYGPIEKQTWRTWCNSTLP